MTDEIKPEDVKLPEPFAWYWKHIVTATGLPVDDGFSRRRVDPTDNTYLMAEGDPRRVSTSVSPIFTADQVRAAVLAERERAASVCDREVQYLCEVGEDRAAVAVGVCAAAIRSGK